MGEIEKEQQTLPSTKRLTKSQYGKLTAEEKKDRRKQRMAEATKAFENALTEMVSSRSFTDYLATVSICHSYSLRNTIWVAMQRGKGMVPPIASYKTWQKLGHQVRKGEHGAMIWVPTPIKVEDPETEKDSVIMRFKTGTVFTRDQVDPIEGKALSVDSPKPEPVTGDSHRHLIGKLTAFAEKTGYEIKQLTPEENPGCHGYHDSEGMVIAYRPEQPANAIVRVLVHELIHSLGTSYQKFGRARAETITDSATFMVCRMLGLDVEKASVPYVAGWGGGDVKKISDDLNLMNQLANQIIDGAKLESDLALSEAESSMRQNKTNSATAKTA